MIGCVIGALSTGLLSDKLVVRLARRNRGVIEPEKRLWPFVVCVVLVPASLILWGVGAAHHIHWVGLVFAMAMLAWTVTCGLILSISYLVDTYPEIAGEAMTSIILIRNTMSFAINYG